VVGHLALFLSDCWRVLNTLEMMDLVFTVAVSPGIGSCRPLIKLSKPRSLNKNATAPIL
jgi:hypothetical protein